jgi:hypothetical protein
MCVYQFLRDPRTQTRRALVLLVLPAEELDWLQQTNEELTLRRCAYWLSLRGRDPVANQRSIRIRLPLANVFSPEALRAMVDRLKGGQEL